MRTIDVEVVDWNQSRRATIPDVPSDLTVGELLGSLSDAMALSEETYIAAVQYSSCSQNSLESTTWAVIGSNSIYGDK